MVIDNVEQLNELRGKDVLLHPISIDNRLHPSCTRIVAFGIIDINTAQSYIVSVCHPEGLFHINNLEFLTGKIYTTNKAILMSNNYIIEDHDVELMYYLRTNKNYEIDTCVMANHYNRALSKCIKTNALIGLVKLEEQAVEIYKNYFDQQLPAGLDYYANKLKRSLLIIQNNGIQVDIDKFNKTFERTFALEGDRCYTQYNIHTITGRPSNRFGGVNFAALPKEDATRECFISRFKGGSLLELDFNSYHPRLIASIVGYDFGQQDVYEHLAQYYYNTTTPTLNQIAKAKEDTFRQLYGGIRRDYLNIPFFAAADNFSKEIWKHMLVHGHVDSLISGRRLFRSNYQDINEHTLFNYYIQMYETENNAQILHTILEYLKIHELKSIPILYTYDSILFDVTPGELDVITKALIPNCIDTDAFPVKLKGGLNYKNLSFL